MWRATPFGQGRTYCFHTEGAHAVECAREGFVWVGMGLLCDVTVNEEWRLIDQVPRQDEYRIEVAVYGPSWVRTSRRFGSSLMGGEAPQTPIES